MDFDDKTKVCRPSPAFMARVWPELFYGQPAPEHITELSPDEVAEIVGNDSRVTQELLAFAEE